MDDDQIRPIGDYFTLATQQRGSKAAAARMLGVSEPTVHRYAKGTQFPEEERIADILRVFHQSPDPLLRTLTRADVRKAIRLAKLRDQREQALRELGRWATESDEAEDLISRLRRLLDGDTG